MLEDTIPLRNVSLPRVGVSADTQIDLSYLHDTSFMQKKQRLTQVNIFIYITFDGTQFGFQEHALLLISSLCYLFRPGWNGRM